MSDSGPGSDLGSGPDLGPDLGHADNPRFPCVCCGHVVFAGPVGSSEICPVCFWEDDLVQTRWPGLEGGPNRASLIACQRNYQRFGASMPNHIKHVRPAAESEPLDMAWYPLGQASLASFEPLEGTHRPWPSDRTVLYWWRPSFWRTSPARWTGWTGPADLTDPGNWTGGFYELALELSDESDDRLQRALTTLWEAAAVDGCYSRPPDHRTHAEEASLTVAALADHGHLHATVLLPTGQRVVCGVFASQIEGDPDWLVFYLPLGALGRVEKTGGFPFGPDGGPASLTWRLRLDDWLADIAGTVHRTVPLRLGLIGFEITGETDAAALGGRVPEERYAGYLLPRGDELDYTAANR